MKRHLFFAGVLSFFFYAGALSQQRALTGTVLMNNNPVRGLTIYTMFASVETDKFGRYVMPLDGCPQCVPGYPLTIYTINKDTGSSVHTYTINRDYRFDFTISKSSMVIFGMVQNVGLGADKLAGIEVTVVHKEIDVSPVKTDANGHFKIRVHKALLEGENGVRLQVRDPAGRFAALRTDPEFFDINNFIILRMQPSAGKAFSVSSHARPDICVNEGDLVNIEADGQIRVGTWVGTSDPDGRSSGVMGMSLEAYNIVSEINHGALMYRIAGKTGWRFVGKRSRFMIGSDEDGCLEFQINDNRQNDNYGAYSVRVSVVKGN